MSLRSLLLLLVGAAIVAFIGVNWSAMTVPTDLNLIFTEIRARRSPFSMTTPLMRIRSFGASFSTSPLIRHPGPSGLS